jgi:hypothetical protein
MPHFPQHPPAVMEASSISNDSGMVETGAYPPPQPMPFYPQYPIIYAPTPMPQTPQIAPIFPTITPQQTQEIATQASSDEQNVKNG